MDQNMNVATKIPWQSQVDKILAKIFIWYQVKKHPDKMKTIDKKFRLQRIYNLLLR